MVLHVKLLGCSKNQPPSALSDNQVRSAQADGWEAPASRGIRRETGQAERRLDIRADPSEFISDIVAAKPAHSQQPVIDRVTFSHER